MDAEDGNTSTTTLYPARGVVPDRACGGESV
jgi:hypothetical protein